MRKDTDFQSGMKQNKDRLFNLSLFIKLIIDIYFLIFGDFFTPLVKR